MADTHTISRTLVLLMAFLFISDRTGSADVVELVNEFDGNSIGLVSYGTIKLTQNGSAVDFEIVANTGNLMGGDIHQLYFNVPDIVDIGQIMVANLSGMSDKAIDDGATSLGVGPVVAGGAGAAFDTGIDFGSGGGNNGNGILTKATFTMSVTAGSISVSDLLSETSTSNNVPPVFMAVHFQSTNIFGATSETVGGALSAPEPGSAVFLAIGCLVMQVARRRR